MYALGSEMPLEEVPRIGQIGIAIPAGGGHGITAGLHETGDAGCLSDELMGPGSTTPSRSGKVRFNGASGPSIRPTVGS